MKKFIKAIISLMLCIILIAAMCLNVYAYQADMVTATFTYGDGPINCYGRLYVIDVGDFWGSSLAEGSAETEISKTTSNLRTLTVEYWFELDSDNTVAESTYASASVSARTHITTGTFDDTIISARCDRLKARHTIRRLVGGGKYEYWIEETVEEGVFYP